MVLFIADKFDQFWAINRRLMESHGDSEGFKHIPIKLYSDDGTCSQRLVSPKNNDGSRKTLQQMIAELYPDKLDGMYTNYILICDVCLFYDNFNLRISIMIL